MANQNQKIVWQAQEFKFYEKSFGWYVTAIIAAILVIGFFVFIQTDYFAASTLGIITIVALYFASHKPGTVTNELNAKGVTVGNIFFPYKQLKYFYMVTDPRHHTVNFVTNTLISREVILELENQDPDEIRNFLLPHLPEHPSEIPSLSQRISHLFKF